MNKRRSVFHILLSLAFAATAASAGTIISESFSGSDATDLVGQPTPDGNLWTGGTVKTKDDTRGAVDGRFSVKQDGSIGGAAFTAYHKFTPAGGRVYTLEAVLSPSNKSDNQWFVVGFALSARDGSAAPNLDGGTTYGQTVLSGSGYRYGWCGPDTKDMSELKGPGLHSGSVKVVLDTTDPAGYTIELFDGDGESFHGPKTIGVPAITQIFIGSSGTDGRFGSLKLSDDSRAAKADGAKLDPAPAVRKAEPAPVLVMFGDSTTDRGMATVVKKYFDEQDKPLLEGLQVINAGKGFDNATSALERLETDVLAHKPDIVTVSFGLNDTGGRKPEQYGESMATIVKTLKAAGIKVVLLTSTPFNNDRHFWAKDFEEEGGLDEYMDREICGRVRSLAESEGVGLCDLHAIFRAEIEKDPGLTDKLISSDGVHLSAEGYQFVAKHLGQQLYKLLTSS